MSGAADRTISAALATPRPGSARHVAQEPPAAVAGLELSDTLWKPLDFFRVNPANAAFRALKSDQYFADLEDDIRENGIMDDLIAMPDGLIMAGESRFIVAQRLGLAKIPVKLVLSPLTPEEQERRMVLHNVLRFEIPAAARAEMLYRIGFYERPAQEAAASLGVTERQVKRDRADAREAERIASEKGKDAPDVEDFLEAREKKNAERRASTAVSGGGMLGRLKAALEVLDARGGDFAESAQYVREAVGV